MSVTSSRSAKLDQEVDGFGARWSAARGPFELLELTSGLVQLLR
jgi:hypothetical protein